MSAHRPMTAFEWSLLILLSLLWGGSFFFIAVSITALPPFTVVFLRCLIGAAGLLIVLAIMRQSVPLTRETIHAFAGMGLLNNVIPQSLIVWAQGSLTSGHASILNATAPFFTILILHLMTTNERATPLKVLGVVIGFTGVAAMIGLDVMANSGSIWPQLAMLAAACCYGFAGLWGRRFATMGIPPVATATGQLACSSAMLLGLALVIEHPLSLPMPSLKVWAAVVALALLSTALAYVVFFRIMATAGATNLSLVTLLIPVSAILLGILFLGEALYPRQIVGMALIGIGLGCIDGRLIQWLLPARKPVP